MSLTLIARGVMCVSVGIIAATIYGQGRMHGARKADAALAALQAQGTASRALYTGEISRAQAEVANAAQRLAAADARIEQEKRDAANHIAQVASDRDCLSPDAASVLQSTIDSANARRPAARRHTAPVARPSAAAAGPAGAGIWITERQWSDWSNRVIAQYRSEAALRAELAAIVQALPPEWIEIR